MQYKFDPKGTGVALITPFQNGGIDYQSLEGIIDHVIEGDVDYIVSLGTTGESSLLSIAEQKDVLAYTIKYVSGRIPIVAGCFGGNNTLALIHKLENFDLSGVSAILSSSPAYVKPTQEGIYQHYSALAKASPVPLILYNVPGRTASNISADVCLQLANAHPNIIAIKDASGDMQQGKSISEHAPAHFSLLSGDDQTALALIENGAKGIISVIANAYPKIFSKMIRDGLSGNKIEAQKTHKMLFDLHPLLYCEGNPTGIKAAMEILGFCTREVRLPLTPLTTSSYQSMDKEMSKF